MAKLLETKPSSSSAEIVASIDDLLIEIIQRLPLKQTVQLRLVSKYWNSLILDPKLCLLRNRPTAGLIFEGHDIYQPLNTYIIFLDKSISPSPFKDSWYQERCHIMHSCNGLLVYASYAGYTTKYYVCNPTTRKYITLPQLVFDNTNESIRGMYLAFDPSMSLHYKVVCVLRLIEDFLYFFEVYSSETGLWRKVGEPFKADSSFSFSDGVYWNGAIHIINIISTPQESVYFNLDCDLITPKVFPTPPLNNYYLITNAYYFGESCDHLHFVDIGRGSNQFIVQEMKRDYSEWFVKYKIIVPGVGVRGGISKQFSVVRGKNDEDSFLVIKFGKMIRKYNFEKNTCETVCNFESATKGRFIYWGTRCPFEYIESLCSV
ncbi:hypothetical protein CASFOL_006801 [Castilleja foliolosa]|uniref:F-box domain-containing protein n=1 Tax=Castilleja foliolosa TaxID=1961234 RepID=A0ABD3E7E4_9LAMI